MIYTIHMIQSRPVALLGADEDARFDGLVAISDGWAKWAVVAPPIWLAVHRLWFALLIYVLVMALGLVLFATPVCCCRMADLHSSGAVFCCWKVMSCKEAGWKPKDMY